MSGAPDGATSALAAPGTEVPRCLGRPRGDRPGSSIGHTGAFLRRKLSEAGSHLNGGHAAIAPARPDLGREPSSRGSEQSSRVSDWVEWRFFVRDSLLTMIVLLRLPNWS